MNLRVSTLQRMLVAGVFLLGIFPTLHAQIVGVIEAEIPFSFIAADTTLGPGSYAIRPVGGDDPALEIRRTDGQQTVVALITRSVGGSLPAKTELIFHRFDDQHYLSLVLVEGNHEKAEIEPSRAETALKREGRTPQIRTLSARHRKVVIDES